MSKPSLPQRWFSGWRAAPESAYEDLADLGTAFGLDMSMDDSRHKPPPPQPQPGAGWARRLGLARKQGH